jgi:hypothetical protein
MRTQTQQIPLTGQITFELDWTPYLAELAGIPTLASAAWILSDGITQASATTSGNIASLTITTNALTRGATHTATCSATLSDGQILQAQIPLVADYLSVIAR